MKKVVILIVLALINLNVNGGNDPYIEAMSEGMKMLNEAQGPQDFLAVANKFERISEADNNKWHPSYYASFAMTLAAATEKDPTVIDENLDAAQRFVDLSSSLSENNSEVLALQGFIYMLRISVDPANRGQQYSGMSAASLQKAKAIDAENPRVLYLLAQLSYGTAMFFGSDGSEACAMNDLALEQFTQAEGIETKYPFTPKWGKEMAQGFKAQCGN
jgi:hypothetical protein